MRTLILTGLAGLALVAAGDAQARARFRAGHAHHPHAEAHPHAGSGPQAGLQPGAPAPDLAVREGAGARPVYVLLPNAGGGPDRATPALASPAPSSTAADPAQDEATRAGPAQAGAPARSVAPVRAPAPAKAVAEAAPWCRSGRVVGTGAGFCMVN